MHLANIPLNVHLGKMIIFGVIFRCLDPILTIAASLASKSPFTRPLGEELEADYARQCFWTYQSDIHTIYRAYSEWRDTYIEYQNNPEFYTSSFITRTMRRFCKENYLSYNNLEIIEDTKKEYLDLLANIGFVNMDDDFNSNQSNFWQPGVQFCRSPLGYNTNSYSFQMINAAITAGLYPKLARISPDTRKIFNRNYELEINCASVLYNKDLSHLPGFLVYNAAVASSYRNVEKVLIWDVSWIHIILVVIFSNQIEIQVSRKRYT